MTIDAMTSQMTQTTSRTRATRVLEVAAGESLRLLRELDCRVSPLLPRHGAGSYHCPICDYRGRFATAWAMTGRRPHAHCPRCRAAERHRLQALVLDRLRTEHAFDRLDMLHVAPEPTFRSRFAAEFRRYVTADLERPDVDLQLDLTSIDLDDNSFDVVYASHVLEHIRDDGAAIAEIARILRPGGFAILAVPIVCTNTIEYPEPVAAEAWHVRAPGVDYFDRFDVFASTQIYSSDDFSDEHQVYVYEDRTRFPNRNAPYRSPSLGRRHRDFVPVCFVG